MYLRPIALQDAVIDFASFPQGYIYSTTGLNPSDHAIQYYLINNGYAVISAPNLIAQDGTTTVNYSVIKPDNSSTAYVFKRKITTPGIYTDKINYYNKTVTLSPLDPNYNLPRPYLTETHTYNYYIFQKSIAIVKIGTSGQNIYQNQIAVMNPNDSLVIDCSLSRGNEAGYLLNIYKRLPFGVWSLATKDSDFSLTVGDSVMSYILTPLIAAEFKVAFSVTGFNSNNNPFGQNNDVRDMISDNSDTLTFYINSGVVPRVDHITFPQIQAQVSAFVDENSNPLGYTNSQIIVSANILYNTGTWVVDSTPITPTNDQWLEVLLDNTNISMHVLDSNGKDIVPSFEGLGPHNVVVPTANNCTFNYVTTIK